MSEPSWALWPLVVALGVQTGAGLLETRVLVPLWASSPPESVLAFRKQANRPDSGRRFWIFLTPLVGLISLVNLVLASISSSPARPWWLFAAGTSLAIIVVTFAYFVPVLLRLFSVQETSAARIARDTRWWVRLNWVRAVLLLLAWLAALKAFSFRA